MILHITVDVSMDAVSDPAAITGRIGEALGAAIRSVEGVAGFQVTRVMPEDIPPPIEPDARPSPEQEETPDDV